ncbi:unnamed protein product [Danaus chrysippus]|uniref:(African queen) hypothetical protein n=1 Tax=Danaus chrysippus TaxID=151541 RepID=A0A8J2QPI5_9NEOP|nr:unnamed protein product [Danaus chrysippus]
MLIKVIALFLFTNSVSSESNDLEGRIVRGDKSSIEDFPYSAFLLMSKERGSFICGSSIINQRILLTAAHCVEVCSPKCKNGAAFFGNEIKRMGLKITIPFAIYHPKYRTTRVHFDIGLALLSRPLKFGKLVKRVAISRRPKIKTAADIAGWGLVDVFSALVELRASSLHQTNCLYEMDKRNGKITAYLGASIPINSNVKRQVEMFSIHGRFNAETGKFNLGIACLDDAVPLTSEIQKIPISLKLPKTNEALHTTGWGKDVPGKLPDYSDLRHLKATKQRTISPRQCQKITKSRMTPAFWCTISINGYHYHGDDGNGLVNSENQLIAVVSYMVNDITVYSDVMREQLWVDTVVMDLFKKLCKKRKML